ncbi:MAG: class I SAM-dependent RNA methyltransferase [Thermodesulfobacteriota bacterium]|nr:class I SAM-dependent RNA methyltransferase [Thermodesulfobacteriota bacterium]
MINSIPDSINVSIEKLVYGGDGLARTNYGVILIPNTAPGDYIRISSIHKRKGILRGRLVDIIRHSRYRTIPFCEHFLEGCGGCQWQHIDYSQQIEIKRKIVEESINRIAKSSFTFPPLVFDPEFKGTRLRGMLHISHKSSEVGFYRLNSNDIVPITECPMIVSSVSNAIFVLKVDSFFLKYTDSVRFITNGRDIYFNIEGRIENKKRYLYEIYESLMQRKDLSIGLTCSKGRNDRLFVGASHIEFSIDDFKYLVNGRTFFQGHITLYKKIIEIIRGLVDYKGSGLLLDLFCGVGFLSISVASYFDRVIGIDNNRESLRLAKENAKRNKIKNMEFYRQDILSKPCFLNIRSADVVIVDPPRRGCPKILMEKLIQLNAHQIIMVSCDPTTMARDIKVLIDNGYKMITGQTIDLFPQTFHIETIVSLSKA